MGPPFWEVDDAPETTPTRIFLNKKKKKKKKLCEVKTSSSVEEIRNCFSLREDENASLSLYEYM